MEKGLFHAGVFGFSAGLFVQREKVHQFFVFDLAGLLVDDSVKLFKLSIDDSAVLDEAALLGEHEGACLYLVEKWVPFA